MSHDSKDDMKLQFPIWSAMLAGIASPASLYAEPQNYKAYAQPWQVSQGFAAAGAYMIKSMARLENVGHSTGSAHTDRRIKAGS
jgi:hypothetical protein